MELKKKNNNKHPRRPQMETEKLVAASRALIYAIRMVRECYKALASERYGDDSVEHDALLESFLLHTRELLEFFDPGDIAKGSYDTVIATDFFWPQEWTLPDVPPYLNENRERLHKRLAHLTYARAHLSPKWEPHTICIELDRLIRHFSNKVDTKKLACPIDPLLATDGQRPILTVTGTSGVVASEWIGKQIDNGL